MPPVKKTKYKIVIEFQASSESSSNKSEFDGLDAEREIEIKKIFQNTWVAGTATGLIVMMIGWFF